MKKGLFDFRNEVYRRWALLLILQVFIFSGCAAFTSHYDAVSYEHITALKAFHMKFIDDFTFEEGKQWNNDEFLRKRDIGELKFQEALEYEKLKSKRDPLRENAINILYEEFKANCELLEKRAKAEKFFFSKVFAEEIKATIERNYGLAVKGELGRVGANNK